uniref:Uncharacterized protein n=1 Tax=Eptatretus burgeri TaxID=7764 RepID=A0A8C4R1D3_EPTBU
MAGEDSAADMMQLQRELQNLWYKKDILKLRGVCREAFEKMSKPRTVVLSLLEKNPDWRRGKTSCLANHLTYELSKWLQCHADSLQPETLNTNLQRRVLRIIVDVVGPGLDHLVDLYCLKMLDKAELLTVVKGLVTTGRPKEAANLALKLELQPYLDFKEICQPLLLQDKLNIVELYVGSQEDMQKCLVQLLDSWCAPDFDHVVLFRQYQGLPQLKKEHLQPHKLSKTLSRLLKTYGISADFCPNLKKQRGLAAIKYLLFKKYREVCTCI